MCESPNLDSLTQIGLSRTRTLSHLLLIGSLSIVMSLIQSITNNQSGQRVRSVRESPCAREAVCNFGKFLTFDSNSTSGFEESDVLKIYHRLDVNFADLVS